MVPRVPIHFKENSAVAAKRIASLTVVWPVKRKRGIADE
jgi:hypothetical protein